MTDADAPASGWVRVTITVDPRLDPAAIEVASAVLWGAGAAGVEEQESDAAVLLIGGFEDAGAAAEAVVQAGRQHLAATSSPIEDDGLDGWREWAAAERAGRFWITPPWVDPPALHPGEQVLWIDPGPTFGSGSHPTTRLVLAVLQDLVDPTTSVLDVGCGSGVLAIGAACCGAPAVLATDIDPASPATVAANAERNGVGAVVRTTTDPVGTLAGHDEPFAVVAANLLAPVITELGADLVACVAPGGRLVLSGLLADRWEATLPAVAPLTVERIVEEDGWVAVVLR